jgi:hypothetical protein
MVFKQAEEIPFEVIGQKGLVEQFVYQAVKA